MTKENEPVSAQKEIRGSWLRRIFNSPFALGLINTLIELGFIGGAVYQHIKDSQRMPSVEELKKLVQEAVLVDANQISQTGADLYLEGVRQALEGNFFKAVGLMILGASCDFLDGSRARGKGGLILKITHKHKGPFSFATSDGQLVDVLADRRREVIACLMMAKKLKELSLTDNNNWQAMVDAALSCALSSVCRAYVESQGL